MAKVLAIPNYTLCAKLSVIGRGSPGIAESEFSESGGHVEIWLRGIRGTPRRIKARFFFTFHPEEIYAPLPGRVKIRRQTFQRNAEFRDPHVVLSVLMHASPQATFHLCK